MQQNIRKELKNLCLEILKQDESDDLTAVLTDCQNLLQKLLVVDYLERNGWENKQMQPPRHQKETIVPSSEEKESPSAQEEKPSSPVRENHTSTRQEKDEALNPAEQENKKLEQIEATKNEDSPLQAVPDTDEPTVPETLSLDDFTTPEADNHSASENKGSLNERFAQTKLVFGLNDRIAFVKHLFKGNMDDFNRVVSQLNTLEDFAEAENFVENMVKPDYDWRQKEEYEMRFKNRVRQRFGLDEIEE